MPGAACWNAYCSTNGGDRRTFVQHTDTPCCATRDHNQWSQFRCKHHDTLVQVCSQMLASGHGICCSARMQLAQPCMPHALLRHTNPAVKAVPFADWGACAAALRTHSCSNSELLATIGLAFINEVASCITWRILFSNIPADRHGGHTLGSQHARLVIRSGTAAQ
jgi:hypothetical protein